MNKQPITGPVELLKSAWSFYRSHWKQLCAVVLIPYAAMYIGSVLQSTKNPLLLILGILVSIAGGVYLIAGYAALVDAMKKIAADPSGSLSLKAQFKAGFSIFWPMVLVGLITYVVTLGSMLVFIIPGFIVGIYISFGLFALVLDGKRGFSALTESFSVVRGRWWHVFGRLIVVGLVNAVLMLIIVGLLYVSSAGTTVTAIARVIVNIAFIPFALTYLYHLYSSLKATRSPEVQTKNFKRWLVVFLIVFVLFVFTIPVILASLNSARHLRLEAQNAAEAQSAIAK